MQRIKATIIASMAITSLGLTSCGDGEGSENVNNTAVKDTTTLEDRTENIENIFFNIPSPIETVNILKKAGATYEFNLPLEPQKVDDFENTIDQSLALGIYGADLNYASVFDKTDDMYFFLACAEKLGGKIGIGQIFGKDLTDRIEMNVQNKDSMQVIISETFWDLDAKLHEEGRETVSALVICGGWLEGIYLATQLVVLNPNNEEIKQRIAEQKYSIENLNKLLASYGDAEDLEDIAFSLEQLGELFNKIEEVKTIPESSVDEDGMPIVGQEISLEMSDELLDEITKYVAEIRADITY